MKASSSEPWITKGCEPSTKKNNSWINTFLWVLSGFVFLLCWRWKYTHACNLGQGYLIWRLKERDGWGLVFAYEIWLESRLAVELRIMAEQQQSRALVSSALILPRPASRSATISSIPQRGPVWQGVAVVVVGGGGLLKMLQWKLLTFPSHTLCQPFKHVAPGGLQRPACAPLQFSPSKEGQEGLRQQKAAGGVLCPFIPKVPFCQGLLWRPTCTL